MLECCQRITRFSGPGRESFMASEKLQDFVLIHDYIGVDLEEGWNVASSRIPELQAVLEQFLAGESPGSAPSHCRESEQINELDHRHPRRADQGAQRTWGQFTMLRYRQARRMSWLD
jgi:hypothetical protein